MPVAKDYTNMVFGQLKCLKRAESRNGHTYWLCECLNCGALKEVQTSHLTSGASKTCGFCNPSSCKKVCPVCGKEFEVPISKNKRTFCFDCFPEPDISLSKTEKITLRRRFIKKKLVEYAGGKCQRCGYDKSLRALEFHHLDPKEKNFTIGETNASFLEQKEEIKKCILLCSNCHAELHEELDLIHNEGLAESG